jgi:hypothetical protein
MRVRPTAWLAVVLALLAACSGGDEKQDNTFGPAGDGGSAGVIIVPEGDAIVPGETFAVAPIDPSIDVSIVDGVITKMTDADGGAVTTITFTATFASGGAVQATWSLDRGDLGTIDPATGTFTPKGRSGTVVVTATYAGVGVATKLTISVRAVQNGRPGPLDATIEVGVGGIGGVGGEGLGGPVDEATRTLLLTGAAPPASQAELGILYPYDKTVWPRGLFAPLIQWQTTHAVKAVYIHLTQKNYEFSGFYSGNKLVRQPIDQAAWDAALGGNEGDPLHVEITVADDTAAWGPRSVDWTVAPGILRGTVYYNSYNTRLATQLAGAPAAAAVLSIRPGVSDPTLTLPGAGAKCIVCHTVSDDGSTLFAQDAIEPGDDYKNGASFDLTKSGAKIQDYQGSASDGTTNNRKFLWAGLSKDGTYALQSSGNTQESYGGASRIFRRDNGNAETATGLDGAIEQAVTPAFSRDMTKVAFNYWKGTLSPGGGDGHTLDVMDFVCTAAASAATGAPSCSAYAFSKLTRLYTNTDTTNGYVGWPAWLPDSSGIVFHNVVKKPDNGSALATWNKAKAQLWFTDVPADGAALPQPIVLAALNGVAPDGKTSILPLSPSASGHSDDSQMNYEPTVNPIASGGYFWVVFTSRRAYGNVAEGDPYDGGNGSYPVTKKLWVAAIDLKPTPGEDPSHPAWYLPGQEMNAGNMRGFWVVDPCKPDGGSCETGDECCGGFCRADASGALVCGGKTTGCSREFERCTQTSDCCDATAGYECLNGFCAKPASVR